MHPHRITTSFITVIGMACCLVLGGFASPAAAKTIVVTTLADIANPPFDADGVCGTGTLSDLPGTDHLISLREAISAANNTNGNHTITFDPSLSGGTIVVNFDDLDANGDPDPLPALCGGHLSLKGDLNGDDVPDITLEGSALPAFVPAAGLGIVSSHNTIQGLRVRHFPFGIVVQARNFPTPGTPGAVTHTTVTNNVVAESSFHGLLVLAQGDHNVLSHTTLTDNEVRGNGFFGIYMLSLGDHNVLSNATLARNIVSSNTLVGIIIQGGFGGADDNTLKADITDNTVTDNGFAGIEVVGGFDNSSNNHVEARILRNTVERGHQHQGILALAALGAVNFPTGTSNNNVRTYAQYG